MAIPIISVAQAAVESLYGVVADRKTRARGRSVVQSLSEIISGLNEAYASDVTIVATDGANMGAEDSDLIATGGLFTALGRIGVEGDIFVSSDNADTTDNALQTAKGGAPAAGDLFQVLAGAATIAWLGNTGTPVQVDTEDRDTFIDV
jgi:hypothetical protein